MPLNFLTDAQVAGYGRFDRVPSRADLERFFVLDDVDRKLIGGRRGEHNRLGLMLQATTVRYVGRFLEDPLDVPWPVAEYVAAQLGIADASCVKRYTDRPMTAYEHAWQIREAYGLRVFEDAKMISPQNLAIGAAAAAGLVGREGELFRKVLPRSIVFLAGACLLVYLQSTPVLSWMVLTH
jgi:hypothetical protein